MPGTWLLSVALVCATVPNADITTNTLVIPTLMRVIVAPESLLVFSMRWETGAAAQTATGLFDELSRGDAELD